MSGVATVHTRPLTRALTKAITGFGGGAAVTPDGGLLSITIADSTIINENGSGIGYNGDGSVAIVVLKNITDTVGTVFAHDLVLTVSDPGYTTTGTQTTRTRTINGVAPLQQQHPNGDDMLISTDGTDLTIYVPLDDWIYDGTTLVSAEIGGSFYPLCTASSAGTKTNLSTLAYQKPLCGWINPQQERVTGSTHHVEFEAFHRHAMAGQQVACVKLQASDSDGSNAGAVSTVSVPVLSTRQTKGYIAEVWAAEVDTSTITQAEVCNVNAIAYPWLGDSSAVLDLSSDGVTWPTALPRAQLRVFCDRAGTYGGAYAYVDGTGAGTPAVSATPATAKANPYATINAAMAAIQTWNNSNKSHNDLGGATIRLMDDGAGGAKTHSMSAGAVDAAGSTWCVIEKDPDTAAVVTFTGNGVKMLPTLTGFQNLRIASNAGSDYTIIGYNASRSMIYLDNCAVDNTSAKQIVTWVAMKYLLNLDLSGGNEIQFSGLASATSNIVSMIGVVADGTTTTTNTDAKLMIGCYLPGVGPRKDDNASGDGDHGRILYNSRTNAPVFVHTAAKTINYGFGIFQCVFETLGSVGLSLFADGDLTTCDNVMVMDTTVAGERANIGYNDVVASQVAPYGVRKIVTLKGNVFDNRNWKGGTFNSGAGAPGSFQLGYDVGNSGNVVCFGSVDRNPTDAPHNDNSDVPYMGLAYNTKSEYNLRRSGLGSPSAATVLAYFTNWTAAPQAVPALGGNYQPVSGASDLKIGADAGFTRFLKDIAGNTRMTDGTAAAGAYEAAA